MTKTGTKDYLLGRIRNGGTLTGGQQVKLCLMLSYPAILAQLSFVMMQYIDTSMVGHLGAAAGASIGLVSTCMWLLGGFCGACGSGFSVQVAHLIGANDFKNARVVLRQALLTALIFSGVISVIGMAIAGPSPIGWAAVRKSSPTPRNTSSSWRHPCLSCRSTGCAPPCCR
jgi:Na+-driven multidrug efflux pump